MAVPRGPAASQRELAMRGRATPATGILATPGNGLAAIPGVVPGTIDKAGFAARLQHTWYSRCGSLWQSPSHREQSVT